MTTRLTRIAISALEEATARFMDWDRGMARIVAKEVIREKIKSAWGQGIDPDSEVFRFIASEIERMKAAQTDRRR